MRRHKEGTWLVLISQELNPGLLTCRLVLWSLHNSVTPFITRWNSLGITPVKTRATYFWGSVCVAATDSVRCRTAPQEAAPRSWLTSPGRNQLLELRKNLLNSWWVSDAAKAERKRVFTASRRAWSCLRLYSACSLCSHLLNHRDAEAMICQVWICRWCCALPWAVHSSPWKTGSVQNTHYLILVWFMKWNPHGSISQLGRC